MGKLVQMPVEMPVGNMPKRGPVFGGGWRQTKRTQPPVQPPVGGSTPDRRPKPAAKAVSRPRQSAKPASPAASKATAASNQRWRKQ